MTYSDGKVIVTVWENDCMHGEGIITEKGATRRVTFYKDLELNVDETGCYNNFHWNLLLVFSTYICFYLAATAKDFD